MDRNEVGSSAYAGRRLYSWRSRYYHWCWNDRYISTYCAAIIELRLSPPIHGRWHLLLTNTWSRYWKSAPVSDCGRVPSYDDSASYLESWRPTHTICWPFNPIFSSCTPVDITAHREFFVYNSHWRALNFNGLVCRTDTLRLSVARSRSWWVFRFNLIPLSLIPCTIQVCYTLRREASFRTAINSWYQLKQVFQATEPVSVDEQGLLPREGLALTTKHSHLLDRCSISLYQALQSIQRLTQMLRFSFKPPRSKAFNVKDEQSLLSSIFTSK